MQLNLDTMSVDDIVDSQGGACMRYAVKDSVWSESSDGDRGGSGSTKGSVKSSSLAHAPPNLDDRRLHASS